MECEISANIRGWFEDVPDTEKKNGMLEMLFSNEFKVLHLVRALMPRPPDPPSQFSPALLR